MPIEVANDIINFIFNHTPIKEKIEILFTGGEPLIEFELLKQVTSLIKKLSSFQDRDVKLSLITNGTIFSEEIKKFLLDNNFSLCISCDGPAFIHDVMRHFQYNRGSSYLVEQTLKEAVNIFSNISVQATYHPATFRNLHYVIEYLISIGVKNIYLNPDFTAHWTKKDADLLPVIYHKIANWYLNYAQKNESIYINLINKKLEIIQQGGYMTSDKCSPGSSGMAFSPSGDIYPCDRFITDSSNNENSIGNIYEGLFQERINQKETTGFDFQEKCIFCDFKNLCMNWCCCSNYLTSGFYDKAGPFLCASEKAAINTAINIYKTLRQGSTRASFFI
jgi:uncharacterized protein